MNILNVVNSILAYSDPTTTDNPQMRAFDFTRKFSSIQVSNPTTDFKVVPPGGSLQLFNGTVTSLLDNTSVVSIQLLPGQASLYRVSVTSGPASFRTARTISGLGTTTVTINNNAIAVFDFGTATLSGVVTGDTLRISGQILNDTGPFAFSPVNAGFWTIIGISGTQLSCVRFMCEEFQAVNQTVTATPSDVQIYSTAGIQVGNKVSIQGTLSPASQRTYVVQAVTPTTFDIMSSTPLPNQAGLSYTPGSFVFYSNSKRLIYLEVDQDAVVQVNADTSNNNSVNPIAPGRDDLVGYFHKFGDTYAATVVNRSINPMNLKWFTAE